MSARGEAPAPLSSPAALLAPGDDVFFWVDRAGACVAARGRAFLSAPPPIGSPPARFFGISPFAATPEAGRFTRYEELRRFDARDASPPAASLPVLRGNLTDDTARAHWHALVRRALDTIDSGAASKIVCARSVRLVAAAPIDAQALALSMLPAQGTYRYLIRQGDVIFAGASPERLIEKHGDIVRTDAVAGTAPAEHDGTPLDQREKDKREHLAVVLAIEEALAPHTLALEHGDEPLVRKVGPIAHLFTPFEGRVDPATHVLDLAAALHPTPAVAGTPRDVALDFIARHEGLERGFYAGPVGWVDQNGDGELAVALRCVRIEGTAVDLYAGAGIVEGSDPDAEFDETVLKMRSTLASLGFELVA